MSRINSSFRARVLLVIMGVLLILLGIALAVFTAVSSGIVWAVFFVGVVFILLSTGTGAQVLMGSYEPMRKKPEYSEHYHVQQYENPWGSILAENKPERKVNESHSSAQNVLAYLNTQYKDGLLSKKEYKHKKQEILRKNP